MNKYLTLEEKQSLVNMLQKHYTIEEGPFISNLTEDNEEKVELTLKAFSLKGRTLEAKAKLATSVSTKNLGIVQIDHLKEKLCLIKCIKECTNVSLKDAKELVDALVSRFSDGTYVWNPFKVGDEKDCKFTMKNWTAIAFNLGTLCDERGETFKWHYV